MKNLFTKTLLSFLLLICLSSFAKEQPKGITLTKENDGYRVDFVLPDYYMNNTLAAGNNYTSLNIPEYGEQTNVGQPNLPQISFSIMVAYDELIPTVNILNQIKDLKILSNKIYPVQQGWSKNLRLEDRPFTIDSKYYESNGNFNAPLVKISEPFIVGGVKGVMITINPFNYDPSANKLSITKTGSFKIQLKNQPALTIAPTPAFNELYDAMFLNYVTTKATGTGRYLIITAPDYESGLTPLVNEKTGLGYIVTVVNTTTTGSTNTAIKTYLQNLYNNVSTRPEFVLLVGDIDKIPGWTGTGTPDNPPTDLNYSCLEGSDPYADVFLGRFPVTSLTQLSNMITKTLYMENAINGLPKKNVFCASSDNYAITEATHNFCIDSFFVPTVYTNIKLYCHTYSATTQQLTDALNANQTFAIYSGHGSETSWADGPPFSASNVNALTNTVFPYTYSFSCLTGNFMYSSECFAETWVRGTKGAVTYWGSSVTSYWDQDDILQKRIFRAMFVEHLTKTSPSFVLGKYLLTQYYGGPTGTYMQRYLEEYNLMGDPSIYMATYGPAIAHTPLPNTENVAGPYVVNCVITPAGQPITGTKLFWTRGTTFTDSVTMTNTSGTNWTANIPGNGSAATYKYYIKTSDNAGLIGTSPGGAPVNYHSFVASVDNQKPVITHTALPNQPKLTWPATVTADVTDNIGVDSAWVKWYINSTSTGIKRFKLNNAGGSTYSAAFNSVPGDINFNDIIYYRIFARDNSSNHNTDSTALYQFTIINQVTITVGTGTSTEAYPIDRFYNYMRWQAIYSASEIGATGNITSIKFYQSNGMSGVTSGPTTIYMKLVTDESLATGNWDVTGHTTVYTGTINNLASPGWMEITLTSPFNLTAGMNLLISIDRGYQSYITTYPLFNYTVTSATKSRRNRSDTAIPTSLTSSTYRANIQLVMSSILGVSNPVAEIPTKFDLKQNYPNPFNPVTKINFDIPKQGLVTLKVFDVLGREVKTLVNEVKAPGVYSVDFNGVEFSSGVYFYRLESNGFMDIKRMILIK